MKKILILAFFIMPAMAWPSYSQSKKELKEQIEKLQIQLAQSQEYNYALLTQNEDLRKRIGQILNCVIEATDNIPAAVSLDNVKTQSNTGVSHPNNNSAVSNASSRPASTSSYSPRKTSSYSGSSYSSSSGRTIYTGPRGGRYYINSKGNKVYIKR